MSEPSIPSPPTRHFLKDALSAVAFVVLAFALTKATWRTFGPFGGAFFLAVTGGIGWAFARAAWRGLMENRPTYQRLPKGR